MSCRSESKLRPNCVQIVFKVLLGLYMYVVVLVGCFWWRVNNVSCCVASFLVALLVALPNFSNIAQVSTMVSSKVLPFQPLLYLRFPRFLVLYI